MPSDPSRVFAERRKEPRVEITAPGRVMYGDGLRLWADCTIKDLSPSGACIQLPRVYPLPNRFVLLHFRDAVAFEALLKWRRRDLAGMSFEWRHDLAGLEDPRLARVTEAWRALGPGIAPRK